MLKTENGGLKLSVAKYIMRPQRHTFHSALVKLGSGTARTFGSRPRGSVPLCGDSSRANEVILTVDAESVAGLVSSAKIKWDSGSEKDFGGAVGWEGDEDFIEGDDDGGREEKSAGGGRLGARAAMRLEGEGVKAALEFAGGFFGREDDASTFDGRDACLRRGDGPLGGGDQAPWDGTEDGVNEVSGDERAFGTAY